MKTNKIDYRLLAVDKENDTVQYNDQLHKYWLKDKEAECISVTTLIHKFTTFDEDFWSSYKALEALVGPELFSEVKPDLLEHHKFNPGYYTHFNISEETFLKAKNDILKDWEEKRETSCIRGTAIHRSHELLHLGGQTKELAQFGLENSGLQPNTSNKIKFGDRGVYPELLLSRISPDGKLRLAGQADLVIIDGEDVYICDYKTNKEIKTKGFYDRKKRKSSRMKYPLNNLDDTNFWHYTIQLSTYAWMIEKIDPRFKIKLLMLLHYDHEGGVTTYECEYRKDDVERMLAYYKKQIEDEEFKSKNTKVLFQ